MGNAQGMENGGLNTQISTLDDLHHFEHTFKGRLLDATPGLLPEPVPERTNSPMRLSALDNLGDEGRPVTIELRGHEVQLREALTVGAERTLVAVRFNAIGQLIWDHAQSCVKIIRVRSGGDDTENIFVTVRVENSLEVETELKLRIKTEMKRGGSGLGMPQFQYIGMFAGPTKPKPFQRRRPNLSAEVPEGVLPPIQEMRTLAAQAQRGSSRPLPPGTSKRAEHALELVYKGENRFPFLWADGVGDMHAGELVFTWGKLEAQTRNAIKSISMDDISEWELTDISHQIATRGGGQGSSGLEIFLDESKHGGEDSVRLYFGMAVEVLMLVKHTMEYFYNKHRAAKGLPPKPGSTHGRSVAKVYTLRGDLDAPEPPRGRIEVIDVDGSSMRAGQVVRSPKRPNLRKAGTPSASSGLRGMVSDKPVVLKSNTLVKQHWEKTVLHQGWLLKKGGGAVKKWLWRYFVLYNTSQGHFLAYYSDVSEVPLFCNERKERGGGPLDICKITFIRPVTKSKGTPPDTFAFDLVTIDDELTLCADSQAAQQVWMRCLNHAVDSDVAVVADEELQYKVGVRYAQGNGKYGPEVEASCRISSMGVVLEETGPGDVSREGSTRGPCTYWCYTDFFKWTLVDLSEGYMGLALTCFKNAGFEEKQELLVVHAQVPKIATAVEYYIEKFMAIMHLRVEVTGMEEPLDGEEDFEEDQAATSPSPPRGNRRGSMALATGASDWQEPPTPQVRSPNPSGNKANQSGLSRNKGGLAPPEESLISWDDEDDDGYVYTPAVKETSPGKTSAFFPDSRSSFNNGVGTPDTHPPSPNTLTREASSDLLTLFTVPATPSRLFPSPSASVPGSAGQGGFGLGSPPSYQSTQAQGGWGGNMMPPPPPSPAASLSPYGGGARGLNGPGPSKMAQMESFGGAAQGGQAGSPMQAQAMAGPLPVDPSMFVEPAPMPNESFRQQWRAVVGADQTCQAVLTSVCPLSASTITGVLTTALRLADVPEVAANANLGPGLALVSAAGIIRMGQGQPALAMVGVEINGKAGALRATVKSMNPVAARGLLGALKSALVGSGLVRS